MVWPLKASGRFCKIQPNRPAKVVVNRNRPKLVVDITQTFGTKLAALRCFKSQWVTMITLLWSVYLRAIKNGLFNGCLFAEKFYKIK